MQFSSASRGATNHTTPHHTTDCTLLSFSTLKATVALLSVPYLPLTSYLLPPLFSTRPCDPTGSGWVSVRLNKEPPEDYAVVEYLGVGEPNLSATPMPLSSYSPGGARQVRMPIPPGPEPNDEDDLEPDLLKIKTGGLSEDDNCTICMSSELRGNRSIRVFYGGTRTYC